RERGMRRILLLLISLSTLFLASVKLETAELEDNDDMSSFEPFIPASATLRELTIVAQHGELKYPEGTPCAEALKVGASEESRAAAAEGTHFTGHADEATAGGKTIIAGFGFGFLLYGVQPVFKTWREHPTKAFGAPFDASSISIENNPACVGYIIGPRIASLMAGGGVLSYLV